MAESTNRRRTDIIPDARAMRVLIVDDDPNYRTWLGAMLRRFGFEVTSAADGTDALDMVHTSPPFDLLIVDCEMPRCDGLTFIAQLRGHERGADAYALMLTAHEDVDTKIAALRLGYDDFLMKSAGEIEIVAKLGAARRVVWRQHRLDATVRELYGLATRDELTGLSNRRFFFSEAERMLTLGVDIALVLFDLDGFKSVNDTFGHLAGDRILKDIGSHFLRRTRTEDLIARYGGDEFVMLVHALEVPIVEGLAARMADEIGAIQWTFGTDTITVGVTTGIACASLIADPTVPHLLEAADRDLYKNKWVRSNPAADPSLYEYPIDRDAALIRFRAEEDEHRSKANGE